MEFWTIVILSQSCQEQNFMLLALCFLVLYYMILCFYEMKIIFAIELYIIRFITIFNLSLFIYFRMIYVWQFHFNFSLWFRTCTRRDLRGNNTSFIDAIYEIVSSGNYNDTSTCVRFIKTSGVLGLEHVSYESRFIFSFIWSYKFDLIDKTGVFLTIC